MRTFRALTKNLLRRPFSSSQANQILKGTPNIDSIPYMTKTEVLEPIMNSVKLKEFLLKKIEKDGPMSFSKFMEESLTNKNFGYYSKQDPFNTDGDFVTSPEISQMFGECVGIWVVNFLMTTGTLDGSMKNSGFDILEFGPGRGTLMKDVLRTLGQFKVQGDMRIHFIEKSEHLRKIQMEGLQSQFNQQDIYFEYYSTKEPTVATPKAGEGPNDKKNIRAEVFSNEDHKISLSWYSDYESFLSENYKDLVGGNLGVNRTSKEPAVARPTIILCNEIFDALPISIFEYTKRGWCEKLVGKSPLINAEHQAKQYFQWEYSEPDADSITKILNPKKTFKSETVRKNLSIGDTIEISPQSLVMMNSFGELISKTGGALLAIDYGEANAFSNSLRGIYKHKFVLEESLLEMPGECDLSAYVNFMALAEVASQARDVTTGNLLTQGKFLESMGINQRLEV
jgi:NADH dehydrogenase [ubiquinone] 1 alpha subcomplex assembly factor 7